MACRAVHAVERLCNTAPQHQGGRLSPADYPPKKFGQCLLNFLQREEAIELELCETKNQCFRESGWGSKKQEEYCNSVTDSPGIRNSRETCLFGG